MFDGRNGVADLQPACVTALTIPATVYLSPPGGIAKGSGISEPRLLQRERDSAGSQQRREGGGPEHDSCSECDADYEGIRAIQDPAE